MTNIARIAKQPPVKRESNLTTLGLAFIVFLTTIVGSCVPLVFSYLGKQSEKNAAIASQKADWDRQDKVASQVADAATKTAEVATQTASAAKLLLDRQELDSFKTAEAARLLLAANERVAKNSGEMNGKLDVIHDLVNAKMTEAMQNEMDSEIKGLALMKEVLDLKEAAGRPASPVALGVIKKTEEKIAELKNMIAERMRQQELIDAKKVEADDKKKVPIPK